MLLVERSEMTFEQPRDSSGRFVNLDGSGPASVCAILRWGVWDRLLGRRRVSPRTAAIPTVKPDLARLAVPPPPGAPPRITWLGHSSFLVQLEGISLLVDPALRPEGTLGVRRNVPPPIAIAQLPPIRAALVSHAHYDHLDLPTLRAVRVPIVAGLGLARFFRARGLAATELGWWSSTRIDGLTITFVPAQHWARRSLLDQNRTLWGGFVIAGRGGTVYHAGDTALFEGFARIAARFPSLDAALLPIGAYDPAWFMGRHHLDPGQALQALQILGARTLVPMHWGTFKLTDEPLDEPPVRLEAERARLGIPVERVRVLAVGETLELARAGAAQLRSAAAPEP
jgi:L-ascorbate metabolism protein UlaG (beta-lactamase superfamily)